MRKIKFRAWDEESKIMFDIARFDLADYTVYPHLFASGFIGERLKIMQYTGVDDVKGTPIYEGDILKMGITMSYYRRGIVEFENGYFTFTEMWQKGLLIECEEKPDPLNYYYEPEVLGNRYENPEMLKEVKE